MGSLLRDLCRPQGSPWSGALQLEAFRKREAENALGLRYGDPMFSKDFHGLSSIWGHLDISGYAHMYIYICVYTYMYVYVYSICMYMYIAYVCICIYDCMCIYINIYIYTYLSGYIWPISFPRLKDLPWAICQHQLVVNVSTKIQNFGRVESPLRNSVLERT